MATQIWVMPVQVLLAAERASCRVLKAVAQLLPIPLAATAWLTYTLGATTGGELMAKAALDALMMAGFVARILNLYPLPLGTEGMLLGHTWSLAVEEQFYLIWPIILITVLKFKKLKVFCFALMAFILIVFLLKITGQVNAIGNALIHESIFIGCLAAIVRWLKIFKMNVHASISILLVLIIAFIGIFPASWYMELFKHGGRSLIALVTVIIILDLVKNPSSLLSKVLSHSVLVYVGKISYALYLWHVPIFRWFKWHSSLLPWQSFALKIIITLIIAAASFAIIENRSTKFGRRLSKKFISKNNTLEV